MILSRLCGRQYTWNPTTADAIMHSLMNLGCSSFESNWLFLCESSYCVCGMIYFSWYTWSSIIHHSQIKVVDSCLYDDVSGFQVVYRSPPTANSVATAKIAVGGVEGQTVSPPQILVRKYRKFKMNRFLFTSSIWNLGRFKNFQGFFLPLINQFLCSSYSFIKQFTWIQLNW